MNSNMKLKFRMFWECFFILSLQYVIASYIMDVIYQTGVSIHIIRQIIIGIIALIFNSAIGIFIQNGIIPKQENGIVKLDGFWMVLVNISISIFVFSLINDIIAWKRIFTTFLSIVNKNNLLNLINRFRELKIFHIITQPINDDKTFHLIIWIILILSLAIVNLNWIFGLVLFNRKEKKNY